MAFRRAVSMTNLLSALSCAPQSVRNLLLIFAERQPGSQSALAAVVTGRNGAVCHEVEQCGGRVI
jgi:hypothetical protein